ncbi:hypothetical protein QBC37DRAFT_409536 [Rhypophila decipiens]|uniref:Uncharacterized protein n=1 Tax=Rhypophila decipiens TaxID=261697 RepID=A0AAN6YNV8_9PEZI|nr:hypothetical protein QBC37DRAFT_409536 [Rhypophila decipiens]
MAMHSIYTLHQRCCSKTSIVVVVALLTSCLFVLFLFELNVVDSSRIPYRHCRVGEWPPPLENGRPSHDDISQKNDNNNQPHSHSSAKWNDDIHHHQEESRLTKKTLFATTTNSHQVLFLNFSHAKDQEIQDTLRPNGAGVLWKQEKGENLPVGISVFHAMHCLIYLRGILQGALLTPSPPFEQEEEGNKKHGHDPKTHIPPCWSYITQQVMCLGDTTLEPARVVDDKVGIDGDGVGHMCKDLGGILSVHGLLGRMARGEVFEDLGPWRDGQRLEDLFNF